MYRVKRQYQEIKGLVTRLNGETVGLNSELKREFKPGRLGPGTSISIRRATQTDLKLLFDQGNPVVERIAGITKKPTKKLKKNV